MRRRREGGEQVLPEDERELLELGRLLVEGQDRLLLVSRLLLPIVRI